MSKKPSVLFVNRSFYPDAEATGQLLTELCEDLAGDFEVSVVAGQPNQNPEGHEFKRVGTERVGRTTVTRVRHTRFGKRSLLGRACDMTTFLISAAMAVLSRRVDIVVVETDPPLLCLLGWIARWRGAKLVVYLQDIYPDIAVELGKLRAGILTSFLAWAFGRVYRGADRVVVLSGDMKRRLVDSGAPSDKIAIVPNWTDTRRVESRKQDNPFRRELGLDDRFVAMYSGNLGLCQNLDVVLDVAERARDLTDVVFLFIGDGAYRKTLEDRVQRDRMPNVRFVDYQPKDRLSESLSAADLHLVPLDERVSSCLMPSKLYGALASGTPILTIAPLACELSRVVEDGGAGFAVAPADVEGALAVIRKLRDDRALADRMGRRARNLAVSDYDRARSTDRFGDILATLTGVPRTARSQAPADAETLVSPSELATEVTAAISDR